jgi:hypothetical protein
MAELIVLFLDEIKERSGECLVDEVTHSLTTLKVIEDNITCFIALEPAVPKGGTFFKFPAQVGNEKPKVFCVGLFVKEQSAVLQIARIVNGT